jgi:hypothetical protein
MKDQNSDLFWFFVYKLAESLVVSTEKGNTCLIYPKEHKTGYSRHTCTPMLIAALFTIVKLWKQPRCPTTDQQIEKLWYISTMKYYSARRNNDMGSERIKTWGLKVNGCNWRTSC